MGKIFETDLNKYFYDTGTGKVIQLDKETFYIMNLWFQSSNINSEVFLNDKNIVEKSLKELLNVCIEENLFSAIK